MATMYQVTTTVDLPGLIDACSGDAIPAERVGDGPFECIVERGYYARDLRTQYEAGLDREAIEEWCGTAGLRKTLQIERRTLAEIRAAAADVDVAIYVRWPYEEMFWRVVSEKTGGTK